MPTEEKAPIATNCTDRALEAARAVETLINHSISPNTRRAYTADLADFQRYGGFIPSTPDVIAAYLAVLSTGCATATVQRRLATLSRTHDAFGPDNPAKSALVRATMRGIRRTKGVAQRQARPLLKEDLFAILSRLPDTHKGIRDRALLLLGFAGAFRRSELVGLDVADLEPVRQGLIVHLRHSKTDQEGQGRLVGIPHGRTMWCPVRAVEDLLSRLQIEAGPIFRSMGTTSLPSAERLSAEAVSVIVKQCVRGVGLNPNDYSSHSLRSGLVTSAALAGASTWKIRQQTGHASDAMVARYVRPTELFENNAAGVVL